MTMAAPPHHAHRYAANLNGTMARNRKDPGDAVCYDGDLAGARNVFMRTGMARMPAPRVRCRDGASA